MNDTRFLIGFFSGVCLVLAVIAVFALMRPTYVIAEGGGGPGTANGLTAVTAKYGANQDVLFVVDAVREKILVYQYYGEDTRDRTKKDRLELLAVRPIQFDRQLTVDYHGIGPSSEQIYQAIQEKAEKEESGKTKRKRTKRRP